MYAGRFFCILSVAGRRRAVTNATREANETCIAGVLVFLAMGLRCRGAGYLGQETFNQQPAPIGPMTGFLMFGLLSVPMGLVQDRKGKKFVLILGLAVALAGALLPIIAGMYGRQAVIAAGDLSKFSVVLASILLLCAGATILQVCGNPVMRDVSPQGKFSSNLSLAQSVRPWARPWVSCCCRSWRSLGLSWSVNSIFAAALVSRCAPASAHAGRGGAAQRQPAATGFLFLALRRNTFVLTIFWLCSSLNQCAAVERLAWLEHLVNVFRPARAVVPSQPNRRSCAGAHIARLQRRSEPDICRNRGGGAGVREYLPVDLFHRG